MQGEVGQETQTIEFRITHQNCCARQNPRREEERETNGSIKTEEMVKVRMRRLEQFYVFKSCVLKRKKVFPNRNYKPKQQIGINTGRKSNTRLPIKNLEGRIELKPHRLLFLEKLSFHQYP